MPLRVPWALTRWPFCGEMCCFISRFCTSEWKFRKESEPTMHIEVPIQCYILTFHLAQDQTCEIVMRYELWRSLWSPSSEKRFCWLYHLFPFFSGEMWRLSKFGTSCVARHSQSFWDSLGTKAWSRNLGCSMSRDANMPEVEDLLLSQLWFCGQLEWWRMIYFTWHKRIILEISYQGMWMDVCGGWGPGNRERSRLPIPLEWSKHWMLQGRIESLSSHCFWVCMIVWASYHSFSLEDGFHDYVIRGDKADDLHVFWEHRIITDYSDLFRLQYLLLTLDTSQVTPTHLLQQLFGFTETIFWKQQRSIPNTTDNFGYAVRIDSSDETFL